MSKFPLLFLFFVFFSCRPEGDSDILQFDPTGLDVAEDVATDASGKKYPGLDPNKIYCGPGWGRKFCRFLDKYDGKKWTDGGSWIKVSNFSNGIFISFSNLDGIDSNSEGWKIGETTNGGIKWNIEIKRDEVDIFWFRYDYYGSGEEIEYSLTYKCEVVDGSLTFSSTAGHKFIFSP